MCTCLPSVPRDLSRRRRVYAYALEAFCWTANARSRIHEMLSRSSSNSSESESSSVVTDLSLWRGDSNLCQDSPSPWSTKDTFHRPLAPVFSNAEDGARVEWRQDPWLCSFCRDLQSSSRNVIDCGTWGAQALAYTSDERTTNCAVWKALSLLEL